jgi:hypothetical protein
VRRHDDIGVIAVGDVCQGDHFSKGFFSPPHGIGNT